MTATSRPIASPPPAFPRGGALALVAGGMALFLAMLYLIGAGAGSGGERGGAEAHAAANGLNGYSGLVRLTEAQGYTIIRSRSPASLQTDGLLVLAPSLAADPDSLGRILADRRFSGPTLVIVPKWAARPPPPNLSPTTGAKFRRGWVNLEGAFASEWPEQLPAPYAFALALEQGGEGAPPIRWSGMGHAGSMPTTTLLHAAPKGPHRILIGDGGDQILAFAVTPPGNDAGEDPYPVVFLAEPDLANNYGLAARARAAAAIAIIDELTSGGEIGTVTFDMTLNGFGASENLLTLAFRPPFLAATLCLLVALLIVGWRAVRRFGPPAAANAPDLAFGKRQLIVNGANLILRARRYRLLAQPYSVLIARRLAERLGLVRPDPESIDAVLARRLPDEEPYTRRAARLEAATKPDAILGAARSLDDLVTKLQQGSASR